MTRNPAGELTTKERAISTGIGLFLAASAVRPRPNKVLSLLALLGGAALAYRGTTGYCPAKAALAEQPAG
jgi:uncharacterized membrane protein